jgi:transposase
MDNASIHKADSVWKVVSPLAEAAGVRIVFLPAYSPEANPCELVFARSKAHLSNPNFAPNFPLRLRVIMSVAGVSWLTMFRFYKKCISLLPPDA